MKHLTVSETPPELAAMNVSIRERSVATVRPAENSTPHKSMLSSRNSAGACRSRGFHGDVKLVSGSALILQGIGNRPTADVDASYADNAAVNAVVTETSAAYDLAPDWLNSNAAAFVPDNATGVELEHLDGLTIQAADIETLLAMKIAAERDKDTLDIARLLRKLNITNAHDAVDLAYNKYGDYSIPLAAGRDNYLIVFDDALDAPTTLGPDG